MRSTLEEEEDRLSSRSVSTLSDGMTISIDNILKTT
jgi:hypothetical protein